MLNDHEAVAPSGPEAVRGRPESVLASGCAQAGAGALSLIECTVKHVVEDQERQAGRVDVSLYSDAVVLTDDGVELPVEAVAVDGVAHPILYLGFLTFHEGPGLLGWAPKLNALSESLLVETVSAGRVYRASFARGGLVDLLHESPEPRGLRAGCRLTFRPDPLVFGSEPLVPLDVARAVRRVRADARRVQSGAVRLGFRDTSSQLCPHL